MLSCAKSDRAISVAQLAELDRSRDLRAEAKLLVQRASARRAQREASNGQGVPPTGGTPRNLDRSRR